MGRRNKTQYKLQLATSIDKKVRQLQRQLDEHNNLSHLAQKMLLQRVLALLQRGEVKEALNFCQQYVQKGGLG